MRLALLLLLLAPLLGAAQPAVEATIEGRATLVLRRPLAAATPIQGFSAVRVRADGTFWALADTGHAARAHREDLQVVFHHVYIDWRAGTAKLLSAHALRDPDRRLSFPIVNETTSSRVLTTADVNVDAMAVVRDRAWFADDLGPWLIETDMHGRVLAAYGAMLDGKPLRSEAARRGFGGLAATRDGRFLYAALEGALWTGAGWEASGAREYARILEFDLQARRWSARELHYALDAPGHTIADLAMIDARLALVVERGPQYRRLYKVLFDGEQARKLAYVELLAIKMATVEGLELIDPGYAVLTNADRREFVLLRAPAIVGAP
ncbi:MAG TPA: esterase-like activity of phytase family protein [Burkholderiales bacterium]